MSDIKLIRCNEKLDYVVPTPKRLLGSCNDATIRIEFRDGEYQYVPRKHTFLNFAQFSSDELQLIVDELKRLNKRPRREEC
jgi:hypothetical protein